MLKARLTRLAVWRRFNDSFSRKSLPFPTWQPYLSVSIKKKNYYTHVCEGTRGQQDLHSFPLSQEFSLCSRVVCRMRPVWTSIGLCLPRKPQRRLVKHLSSFVSSELVLAAIHTLNSSFHLCTGDMQNADTETHLGNAVRSMTQPYWFIKVSV